MLLFLFAISFCVVITNQSFINVTKIEKIPGVVFDHLAQVRFMSERYNVLTTIDLENFFSMNTFINDTLDKIDLANFYHNYDDSVNKARIITFDKRTKTVERLQGLLFSSFRVYVTNSTENEIKEQQKIIETLERMRINGIDASFPGFNNQVFIKNPISEKAQSIQQNKTELQNFFNSLNSTEEALIIQKTPEEREEVSTKVFEALTMLNMLIEDFIDNIQQLIKILQTKEYDMDTKFVKMGIQQIQLPKKETSPINIETRINIFDMRQITETEINANGWNVILNLKIPMVNKTPFELFKIVPVPINIDTENAARFQLQTNKKFICVSHQTREYIFMLHEDLLNCQKLNSDYLCQTTSPILKKRTCESDLIFYNLWNQCTATQVDNGSFFAVKLTAKNDWIYSASTVNATMSCQDIPRQITLEGVGLLQIPTSCLVKTKNQTLYGANLEGKPRDYFIPATNIKFPKIIIAQPPTDKNIILSRKPENFPFMIHLYVLYSILIIMLAIIITLMSCIFNLQNKSSNNSVRGTEHSFMSLSMDNFDPDIKCEFKGPEPIYASPKKIREVPRIIENPLPTEKTIIEYEL